MKTRFQLFETAIKLQLLGKCSISPNGSVTRTWTSLLAGLTTLSHWSDEQESSSAGRTSTGVSFSECVCRLSLRADEPGLTSTCSSSATFSSKAAGVPDPSPSTLSTSNGLDMARTVVGSWRKGFQGR